MMAAFGYLLLLLAVVSACGGAIWGIVAWDAARRRREQAQQQAAQAWWAWQAQQRTAAEAYQAQQRAAAEAHWFAQQAAAEAQAAEIRRQQELAAHQRLSDLLNMTPNDFEQFVAILLVASNYREVEVSGKSGDRGVDVHAKAPDGRYVVVQCKHYGPGKAVGGPEMRQFLGAIHQHEADLGMFVTTSDFAPQAQEVAQDKPIRLINGTALVQWVQRALSES